MFLYRDAVDEEGDGDISKDEFVKNAMKSKFIFNMLKEQSNLNSQFKHMCRLVDQELLKVYIILY